MWNILVTDSNVKIAVTCEKCGRISVEQLNLFEINNDNEKRLSCSCSSLNCIIYCNELREISFKVDCLDCTDKHTYTYKLSELIFGTEMKCPELGTIIAMVGDRKEISKYIKSAKRDTFKVLYDKNFDLFFNNHNIMKKSLEKLQLLKEDSKVDCYCGNEEIATEIYSGRIVLRCSLCHSDKVIYAEKQEDLKSFYEKSHIEINKSEFEVINVIKKYDNK